MRISDWSSDVCSSDLGGSWTDLSGPDGIVLKNPAQYVGKTHKSRLFKHNGLHIDVLFDSAHPIGKNDRTGIADVILESAITTIADLEDSVAAVDAEDKVAAYSNWLGLMRSEESRVGKEWGSTGRSRGAPSH